jgi:serine/threonine protein phosphatase PrpC
MRLTIRYAGLTDRGRVRQTNEDSWVADPKQGLFIVADGMGGEFAGALASRAVVATLPELVRKQFATTKCFEYKRARQQIAEAIATLSKQLHQQTHNTPGLEGIGSTVVCALVRGSQALVAHMGDSRAYQLRGGRLKRLTTDHTLIQALLHAGDINPREAATHPARGQLTRSVGMPGEPLPVSRLLQLRPGDLLMLCTDGLTGMLGDNQIFSILKNPGPLDIQCRRLVEGANGAGGMDNVTVLLICVEGLQKNGRQIRHRAELASALRSN